MDLKKKQKKHSKFIYYWLQQTPQEYWREQPRKYYENKRPRESWGHWLNKEEREVEQKLKKRQSYFEEK